MPLFKNKAKPPQMQNIQAKVLPVDGGLDPIAGTQTYLVEIQSNNAELLNNSVNNIELATEIKPRSSNTSVNPSNISGIIRQNNLASSTPKSRNIGNIDPKTTVAHGALGLLGQTKIRDNIIRENVKFNEVRFAEVPSISIPGKEVAKGNISFNNDNTSVVATTDNILKGVFEPGDRFKTRGYITPTPVQTVTSVIPKKTTILSQVKVAKNEQVKINLRDINGRIIGRAGNSAANITPPLETPDYQKQLPAFHLLASNPEPFKITTSEDERGFCLHIVSRFPDTFREFQVFARYVSECPKNDRYTLVGEYNYISGQKIYLGVTGKKSMIVHVVPKYKGDLLCWSQTHTIAGIESQAVSRIISYQTALDGYPNGVVVFKIYRYPDAAKKLRVVRTDITSGDQITFQIKDLPSVYETRSQATPTAYTWYDHSAGVRNNIYSYDFFVMDSFGFETHIGNHTTRIFEKDMTGVKFTEALATTTPNTGHVIKFKLFIPDLWIPRSEDNLMNPGDSIFEAAREQKKIGLVQLVRHSDEEDPIIAGTFVINPGQDVSEIPIELLETGEVEGVFEINSAFSKKYGLTKVSGNSEYTYELRAGYYLLGNELSFLKNPVKLTVPNEHTSGKVGYSYHPYSFESPLSKDYSIIPKIGEDKHFMKIEALTDVSRIAVFESRNSFDKTPSIQCYLGANGFGNNKNLPYVTISTDLQAPMIKTLDHIEVLVANSTTGTWLTLGKHRVSKSDFNFIDTVGPSLAANKLKYCLIGRNLNFDEVFKVVAAEISISKYNYRERDDVSANTISVNPLTNNKLR